MKVLIDIPDSNIIENTKSCFGINFDGLDYQKIIMNGTRIPEGATNGDMIKAMFLNLWVEDNGGSIYLHYSDYGWIVFDRDWWNAPYESEGE